VQQEIGDASSRLREFITRGRETRNVEYKGARGREPFAWGPHEVSAEIARTVMGMANIGGGTIVIGMDQIGPDRWEPNGVDDMVDASYTQDKVQQYVNQRADPYVELSVNHVLHDGKRFVIIEVLEFREMPVVCTKGSKPLRQGAIYTRSFEKVETVEVQSQTEMRDMLDRAIDIGVQKRLQTVFEALRSVGIIGTVAAGSDDQFKIQRGDL
jgi:predicted HTH transcriptional regulator